ncbi:MAG: ribosome biogenesis GTPase Der [Rickettsiaceae bacterium]|nr:ribosome biogenesis GTPase Der [Rickettsiaceae bacterium]
MNKIFTVAIIGRPNVGKSTLFNLLSVRTKAIVHDKAGVTRDRKYSLAKLSDLNFQIIDTPGLDFSSDKHSTLAVDMNKQSLLAAEEADATIFVVDATVENMPDYQNFAKALRKFQSKIIFVANKAEKNKELVNDYYKLGFGKPIKISATHKLGLIDLYQALKQKYPENLEQDPGNFISAKAKNKKDIISIAIMGRPNAGKSSFINSILSEERLLVMDEAGTTRESIEIEWEYGGQKLKLIDTAGMRRKKNVTENLEQLSISDTLHSMKFANNVILMLDATEEITKQDLNLANLIIENGRCLNIVFNKMDLVKNSKAFYEEMSYQLAKSLGQVKDVATNYISVIKGHNLDAVLDSVIASHKLWNAKISTSQLNKWLQLARSENSLSVGGSKIKVKYCVQTGIRPPTFKLFANKSSSEIPQNYKQYLLNSLRDAFGLVGVPIRINFTTTQNPYTNNNSINTG